MCSMQAHEVSATYARLELHEERGHCNECLHCRRTGTERLCHYATVISSLLQVTTRSDYPTVIKTQDIACHAMSWDFMGSDIHEPTT